MSGDFSDASIYRSIESLKPTIIIDNFDSLDVEKQKRILHIFNIGAYARQKAVRSEGKTFRPTSFNVFSKLVLNGIDALNEVAENRANITRTFRTDKKEMRDWKPEILDGRKRETLSIAVRCTIGKI